DFAAAAATFKHSIYGDFNLATSEEIEGLMLGDTGGSVKR
ncbi:MAG: sugar kinase, partial [Fimbriimonadaceae bacterium]|nr:sugar kinase [Chitinophagales bacterium]